MTRRSLPLTDALSDYATAHTTQPDQILIDLAAQTLERFGDAAGMQIGSDQGRFMTLLAQLIGAKSAVEIGTFTGYSAICVARGLGPGGKLLCCDVSDEYTSVAREYWKRAELTDRIELRLGPAVGTLAALPEGTSFDFAFIDADKEAYVEYWDLIVPMVRPGGVILVDNTLSHGRVIDPDSTSPTVEGIRAFNSRAVADPRVDLVLLPIGDGLTLARKL